MAYSNRWRLSLELVALSFVLVIAAMVGFLFGDYFIPPREPVSLEVLTPTVRSEGDLTYRAAFKRHKICKTDVRRFIVRFRGDEEKIVFRDEIVGALWLEEHGPTVWGTNTIKLPSLEPGPYQLRLFIISACNLILRVDAFPWAHFEVSPP